MFRPTKNLINFLRRVALAVVMTAGSLSIVATGGCGGGGGGGGGDSGGGSSSPGFSVSPSSLTFNAASTSIPTPASQKITITVSGGIVFVDAFFSGAAIANATFAITGQTTAEITVFPSSPASLGVGTFSGTIRVVGCNDPNCNSQVSGSPKDVNVTYGISGVAVSPAALSYSIGNSPIAADFSRQLTVSGFPTQNWTASTNVPWLVVTPTNGSTGATVQATASLVQAQIDAMNNGTYTGSILIAPTSGTPITTPVTLTISRSQVNYVAPYVAISNTSNEVIIRGENFNLLTIQDVKFANTSATTFNVISSTEVRATHPALAAGTYAVTLQNNLGVNRSSANLVVVDAPVYSATTLAYPTAAGKAVTGIVYDAERAALVVSLDYSSSSSSADNEFLRYSYSGAWGAATRKALSNLYHIALSTDGAQWLAGRDLGIQQFDATSLNAGTSTNDSVNNLSLPHLHYLAVANDGTAVVTAGTSPNCGLLTRYRLRNPAFSSLADASSCSTFSLARVGGSADGSRIIAGNDTSVGVQLFDASSGTLTTPISLLLTSTPTLDRTGARIVLNNTRVYDTNLNFLGGLSSSTQAVALKPDGTLAYSYVGGTTLRTYDLTAPLVGGLYPEVGTGTTLPGNPGSNPKMTISPDGGTLFIAGGSGIVIQPAP